MPETKGLSERIAIEAANVMSWQTFSGNKLEVRDQVSRVIAQQFSPTIDRLISQRDELLAALKELQKAVCENDLMRTTKALFKAESIIQKAEEGL